MHLANRLLPIILLALAFLPLDLPAGPCLAEIYRWQDEQGHWHYSDSPTSEAPIRLPPDPSWDETAPGATLPPPGADLSAESTSAASAGRSPAASVQGGMLWRIGRSAVAPSHLLGTIHSADPRVTRLKPAVQHALDRSERFVMEMQMDAAAILSLGAGMVLTDGRDLETLLGRDLYSSVNQALADYGLPEMAVRHLKPWVAMTMLSMPKPGEGPVLDLMLYQRAQAAGKPTAGLESAQEQLAVFEELSMPDQIALLKMTMDQLPALPGLFDQLIRAYVDDDLQRVADLASGFGGQGNTDVIQRFFLRLNDDRNRRMAMRMLPYLEQGNSFVAVGAMHLAGPAGLIQLLRQRGYDIVPVR